MDRSRQAEASAPRAPPPPLPLPPPAPLPPLADYVGEDGIIGDGWEKPLVDAVQKWFMESEMMTLFADASAFADLHCDVFELELKEHKLEYTALHNQFRQVFEDKLNGYLASIGYTPEHFYVAYEKCVDRDSGTKTMGEIMWCCLEYEFFCQIMCERKREKLGHPS
mmetsp:Transcript_112562/g.303895  ORF Transcript_112562/g.303895 Transcript_112562/m.303895 type:complete len:166 (-) Transcript_112562:153-650(-)